jgi:hypothetical protein
LVPRWMVSGMCNGTGRFTPSFAEKVFLHDSPRPLPMWANIENGTTFVFRSFRPPDPLGPARRPALCPSFPPSHPSHPTLSCRGPPGAASPVFVLAGPLFRRAHLNENPDPATALRPTARTQSNAARTMRQPARRQSNFYLFVI